MKDKALPGWECVTPQTFFPRSADGSLEASKGFLTPVTSLMPPKPPRTEVRQYSWRRKEVCMLIRILNPLTTRKEEESNRKDGEITAPHPNHEKTMTSLSLSRQKSEGKEQQCSINTDRSKSETIQLVHVYQYTTNIYTESRKEQKEMKFNHPESANCQNSDDVISDGINRGGDVNRLIARKRYATTKHSFSHTKEFLKATLNIFKQSFIQLAIVLAVVISLIGSGLDMNLLGSLLWYARNVEIIVKALFLSPSVFLFTQFSLFYENLQLPLPISVKYWVLAFKK